MAINPINSTPALRLIQPVDSAPAVRPVAPASPTTATPRTQPADSFNFESVYRAQLPKVDIATAQARLDRVRDQLVAARVDMPVHFESSPAARSANPYAPTYMKLAPNPADINAAATELNEAE